MQILVRFALSTLLAVGPASAVMADCNCPHQGDGNEDGFIDSSDESVVGDVIVYPGAVSPQDPNCPVHRGDWNADGVIDLRDVDMFWDYQFRGGPPPVDPCACEPNCVGQVGVGTGSVVVESATVFAWSQDTIGVYLSNTTPIDALMVPLVVRAVDTYPLFLTMRLRPDGRIPSDFGVEANNASVSGFDLMNGDCSGGSGTGFGSGSQVFLQFGTLETGNILPLSSPDALRFVIYHIVHTNALQPGSDAAIPSLEIIFTASPIPGTFEIDTTCTTPNSHLSFVESVGHGEVIPSFTMATITVEPCLCPSQGDIDNSSFLDAEDLNLMIDALFFNGSDPEDLDCPTTRTDFDGNGFADALDLNGLIDHLFFGGDGPCNPCNPAQGTCAP